MRIALVGGGEDHRWAVAGVIDACLAGDTAGAGLLQLAAEQCMQVPLPAGIDVALVLVNSMAELEAARQISYLNAEVQLVLVSQSPEFGMEGVRLQATDYLLEPLCREDVERVLARCRQARGQKQ